MEAEREGSRPSRWLLISGILLVALIAFLVAWVAWSSDPCHMDPAKTETLRFCQ